LRTACFLKFRWLFSGAAFGLKFPGDRARRSMIRTSELGH
jgi:hypothetical protein